MGRILGKLCLQNILKGQSQREVWEEGMQSLGHLLIHARSVKLVNSGARLDVQCWEFSRGLRDMYLPYRDKQARSEYWSLSHGHACFQRTMIGCVGDCDTCVILTYSFGVRKRVGI